MSFANIVVLRGLVSESLGGRRLICGHNSSAGIISECHGWRLFFCEHRRLEGFDTI